MRLSIFTLLGLFVPCALVMGQGSPLPQEMRASFTGKTFAGSMYPLVAPQHTEKVRADLAFDTTDRTLTLDWYYRDDGALPANEVEEHQLSYEPTTYCRKAGASPTFFIAGYVQRTGHVIVERWTFSEMALTSYTQGGKTLSGFTRTLHKEVVLLRDDIKPLRAIAYFLPSGRLWLFEEEAPNVVWSVDPETGDSAWLLDASVRPEIANARSSKTFVIGPGAVDGGGFILLLYPWRAWDSPWTGVPSEPTNDTELFLFRDSDADGIVDEESVLTWSDYIDGRDYIDNSNPFYRES